METQNKACKLRSVRRNIIQCMNVRTHGIDFYERNPLPSTREFRIKEEVKKSVVDSKGVDFLPIIPTPDSSCINSYDISSPKRAPNRTINRCRNVVDVNLSPLIRNTSDFKLDIMKRSHQGSIPESLQKNLYAPGKAISGVLEIKILHVNLNFITAEDNFYYLEISCETKWIVKKRWSVLSSLVNRAFHPIYLPVLKAAINTEKSQNFILSNIVDKVDILSDYLYIHDAAKFVVKVRIFHGKMFLYKCNEIYKIVEVLEAANNNDCSFTVRTVEKCILFSCITNKERDGWVDFLNKLHK